MNVMRKKILVIEEDKDVSALFGKALDPKGFDVYAIGAPDKGIEKAIELSPDLIFLDLIFQESNGLKVSKLLHSVEKLKNVPIVMLVSHKSDLDPKYTSTIGVVDTLVLPLEEDAVLSKTLSVLGMGRETAAMEDDTYELPVDEEPGALSDDGRLFEELVTDQQEFVTEADRLIEQSILKNPGEKTLSARLADDAFGREDIPDEKTELPAAEVAQYPDFEAEDEPLRKENTFEDEQYDWKDDRPRKTFKDEFEEEDIKMSDSGPADEDRRSFDDVEVEKEKTAKGKKKLLLAAAVLLTIAAAGLGAYQARRYFFPPETVKTPVTTAPVPTEPVKEALPPTDAIRPAEPVVKKETPPAVKPEGDKKPPVQEKTASMEKTDFKFSIQAGYFENRKNADSLAASLKEKGYDAFVLKTVVSKKGSAGSRTFHRVLIGRFDNIKKAGAQAQTISQKEGLKVIIHRN